MNTATTRRFATRRVLVSVAASCFALNALAADSNSASPTAGGSTSNRAGELAGRAAYQPGQYVNANKQGPQIVVLPGEVKSNNSSFTQRFMPTNIADMAEIELTRANFRVLERTNLAPIMREVELAYNLGDQSAAQGVIKKGQFAATRWIMKFDILKAEPIAEAESGFDGRTVGNVLGTLLGGKAGSVGREVTGSVRTGEASKVWLIGMRYKIIDANTTEQVANGYSEEKMEVGATGTSVAGVGSAAKGGVGLDTMVQRLVQKSVAEIDARHK